MWRWNGSSLVQVVQEQRVVKPAPDLSALPKVYFFPDPDVIDMLKRLFGDLRDPLIYPLFSLDELDAIQKDSSKDDTAKKEIINARIREATPKVDALLPVLRPSCTLTERATILRHFHYGKLFQIVSQETVDIDALKAEVDSLFITPAPVPTLTAAPAATTTSTQPSTEVKRETALQAPHAPSSNQNPVKDAASSTTSTDHEKPKSPTPAPLSYYQRNPGRFWMGIFIGLICASLFVPPLAGIVLPALGLGALVVTLAPTATAILIFIGEVLGVFTFGNLITHAALAFSNHYKGASLVKFATFEIAFFLRVALIFPTLLMASLLYFCNAYCKPLVSFFSVILGIPLAITYVILWTVGITLQAIGWLSTPLASLAKNTGHNSIFAKAVSLLITALILPFWGAIALGQTLQKVANLFFDYIKHVIKQQSLSTGQSGVPERQGRMESAVAVFVRLCPTAVPIRCVPKSKPSTIEVCIAR